MQGDFKPYVWDNRNKMHFDSGYKLFDKQTNCISTGNVIANTQTSSYIRPWSDVDNYGYIGKPGEFLAFDMQFFKNLKDKEILDIIYDKSRKESVILYKFFVNRRSKRTGMYEAEDIGFVLTDYNKKHLAHVILWPGYRRGHLQDKWEAAIKECMNYVCDGWWKKSA